MSLSAERLYNLLPAVYRIRDEQQGKPLFELVSLIAREFGVLEDNVEQLYDDQFIETCQDWVAPYIGDLIGYRSMQGPTAAIASPRADLANTIANRRRKGTAAMLEQVANDVTGWRSRAVEFFEQLATTQYMNHVRPHALTTANVRSNSQMLRLGSAFNSVAHTAEMRRPERGGRYNIPNVGIFLWRLSEFPLTRIPLTPDPDDASGRKFRFNPLGADQQLFRRAVSEDQISHIAEPSNVPEPIGVRLMAKSVREALAAGLDVADDYGFGRSIFLVKADADPLEPDMPIPLADIVISDLRDTPNGWAHEDTIASEANETKIAIDPRLGRVLLGTKIEGDIRATFHTGFSRTIGGGEYERASGTDNNDLPNRIASGGELLQPHLAEIAAGGQLIIADSRTYAEPVSFAVEAEDVGTMPGREVIVSAGEEARPLLQSPGPITLSIGKRGRLILEGLVISGGGLHVPATDDSHERELILRHCTLVPGVSLNPDGTAGAPGAISINVEQPFTTVRLEHCIVGALRIHNDAHLHLTDSIVDAGSASAIAFEGIETGKPGAELTIVDSTIVGKVHTRLMRLASNTMFVAELGQSDTWPAPVIAQRKQEGCVRFSYVPLNALVPKRFRCVPSDIAPNVIPHFTSLRYGHPGYAQLRNATSRAIREGADDGGEIGVMHTLYQPQREANLRTRFDEYLRFGLSAGIFYVT